MMGFIDDLTGGIMKWGTKVGKTCRETVKRSTSYIGNKVTNVASTIGKAKLSGMAKPHIMEKIKIYVDEHKTLITLAMFSSPFFVYFAWVGLVTAIDTIIWLVCLFISVLSWIASTVGLVNVFLLVVMAVIAIYLNHNYIENALKHTQRKYDELSDLAIKTLVDKTDQWLTGVVDGFQQPTVSCNHKYVALRKLRDQAYIYILVHLLMMQFTGLGFRTTFMFFFPIHISFDFVRYSHPELIAAYKSKIQNWFDSRISLLEKILLGCLVCLFVYNLVLCICNIFFLGCCFAPICFVLWAAYKLLPLFVWVVTNIKSTKSPEMQDTQAKQTHKMAKTKSHTHKQKKVKTNKSPLAKITPKEGLVARAKTALQNRSNRKQKEVASSTLEEQSIESSDSTFNKACGLLMNGMMWIVKYPFRKEKQSEKFEEKKEVKNTWV